MIKTFPLQEDSLANDFITTVVEPQITVTDSVIAVSYLTTKENYNQYFATFMIESLNRNLFNEKIRKVSLDAELGEMKEHGTNYPEFDELLKKQKEAEQNIRRFESKINALVAWQTSQS